MAKQAEAEALSHIVPTERGLAHPKTLSSISGATGRSEWRLKSTTETSTNFNSRSAEPSSHRQGRPRVPAQAILPSGVRQAARCRRLGPPEVHTFFDAKTTWDETQMGGRRTQLRSKIPSSTLLSDTLGYGRLVLMGWAPVPARGREYLIPVSMRCT